MTSFPIRSYCASTDLDVCMDIWRRASRAGHQFLGEAALGGDEVLVRDIYMPAAEIWIATSDDLPIGFIALLESFIGGLFVAPEHHGQGVGRKLVQHAAELRGTLDVDVYEANFSAIGFYAQLGFARAARRATDDQGRPFPVISMHRAARSE